MNLSKKSRYGLTALIDLSIHSTKGHVSLISIAERNGISPQYLEHIFARCCEKVWFEECRMYSQQS